MNEKPAWLKRSENGSIGEARARAFLLERFWVLERSVDKDGADYLIQRRLTNDNFLSREAPRLGVIQVKFLQDEKTSIYIEPSYLCDEYGAAYAEFFLLINSGEEDSQRQFILSAKDIISNFGKSRLKRGLDKYYISGTAVMSTSKYEILSRSRALDRIEHALNNADFTRNRMYFGASTGYIKIEKHQIDNDYLIDLDNGYCDIDNDFFNQKRKLQSTLIDIELAVEAMHKIIRTTDPLKAFEIYEDHIKDHVGSRGIEFSFDFFDDEDFYAAAKNHRERLEKLRELELENSYLNLLDRYQDDVLEWIVENEAWDRGKPLKVTAMYRPKTLDKLQLSFELVESPGNELPVVKSSRLGLQVIVLDPVRLTRKWGAPKDASASEIASANAWQVRRTFQREVDRHLLGEDLVSPWM
ncbi:hypothetical protein [Burkholderia cepacia]|nr:hypothetical protein [Burkholderia cepacia]MBY4715847.1 hypothetical protein [Burkholderia cepacia]MBY4735967.1 hypothetical protein [Burkholderia cepacia]MBY4747643.1 hypothetical protein [Burkholderia cepacia]MBY4760847.1 hypothetical protein [Burkholderia cepacia]MBY4779398.1 hypothetical protein [Burkholderia cepacia]